MTAARVVVALLLASHAVPLAAQTADRPTHRFEATVGGLWLGGGSAGSDVAELRQNSVPPAAFSLFNTETRMTSAPGFDGRVAFWLTRALAVEAGFVYTRPVVRTRITGDIEGADPLTLDDDLEQYFVEATAVLVLDALRFGDRTVPFVSGGAGYLRQLHEGRTLVETGQMYHVGGGLRHSLWARERGFGRVVGLRVDARAYVLVDGFTLDDRAGVRGAVTGGAFVTF